MTDREDKIRQRAYSIWEEEGYPHGRAEHHWQRAAREVVEPEAAAPEKPVPASAAAGRKAGSQAPQGRYRRTRARRPQAHYQEDLTGRGSAENHQRAALQGPRTGSRAPHDAVGNRRSPVERPRLVGVAAGRFRRIVIDRNPLADATPERGNGSPPELEGACALFGRSALYFSAPPRAGRA